MSSNHNPTTTLQLTAVDRQNLEWFEDLHNMPDSWRLSYFLADCYFENEQVSWFSPNKTLVVLLDDHERAIVELLSKKYEDVVLTGLMKKIEATRLA